MLYVYLINLLNKLNNNYFIILLLIFIIDLNLGFFLLAIYILFIYKQYISKNPYNNFLYGDTTQINSNNINTNAKSDIYIDQYDNNNIKDRQFYIIPNNNYIQNTEKFMDFLNRDFRSCKTKEEDCWDYYVDYKTL